MKRIPLILLPVLLVALLFGVAFAQDPFAGGEDALAVNDSDGSASLRAKLKLAKMEDDMVMVKVEAVGDKDYPHCVVKAKVLKAPAKQDKFLKLIGRGKSYKFKPVYQGRKGCKKCKGGECGCKKIDLTQDINQNNLGLCYYPKKTKLIIKVGGVDMKAKVFKAAAVYLK